VLHLHIDHPEHGTTTLVAELIGRVSNLILLTPASKILDCIRRAPAKDDADRALLPGRLYAPPPPQDKLPPFDDHRPDYYAQLANVTQSEEPLWRALVAQIAGTSPTLGAGARNRLARQR
jgi:predicted ribosome quality control (RQC) complex YloA/Tae2 family protein